MRSQSSGCHRARGPPADELARRVPEDRFDRRRRVQEGRVGEVPGHDVGGVVGEQAELRFTTGQCVTLGAGGDDRLDAGFDETGERLEGGNSLWGENRRTDARPRRRSRPACRLS